MQSSARPTCHADVAPDEAWPTPPPALPIGPRAHTSLHLCPWVYFIFIFTVQSKVQVLGSALGETLTPKLIKPIAILAILERCNFLPYGAQAAAASTTTTAAVRRRRRRREEEEEETGRLSLRGGGFWRRHDGEEEEEKGGGRRGEIKEVDFFLGASGRDVVVASRRHDDGFRGTTHGGGGGGDVNVSSPALD